MLFGGEIVNIPQKLKTFGGYFYFDLVFYFVILLTVLARLMKA